MKKKFSMAVFMLLLLLEACGNKDKIVPVSEEYAGEESGSSEESGGGSHQETADEETASGVTTELADGEPETAPTSAFKEPAYISQEFTDLLTQITLGEVSPELLQESVAAEMVSGEELEVYAADPAVAECIQYMKESAAGPELCLKADGDSDGIMDLLICSREGGSDYVFRQYFLKGQADGSYVNTSQSVGMTQEFTFVRYNERTYLLEASFDYTLKEFDGFIVKLYEDGEIIERIYINKMVESYESEIAFQAPGYETMASEFAQAGSEAFLDWWTRKWLYNLAGTAETEEGWETLEDTLGLEVSDIYRMFYSLYCSDVDNDGELEWYSKRIFYPSNAYAFLQLEANYFGDKDAVYEEDEVRLLDTYGLEYLGIPVYFWVDSVDDRQILFLFCYDGLDREMLYGYLIEGNEVTVVMEVNYIGIPRIEYYLY